MIDETQLSYQRGTLAEFRLRLGGGERCRGLVLNTAVLMGKGARQVWILDMDDATPELTAQWTKKKYIVERLPLYHPVDCYRWRRAPPRQSSLLSCARLAG